MASINLDIASRLDITCRRNDTFSLDMDWTDVNDSAIDLTTYTFKMEVRRNATSGTALLTFNNAEFTTKDANGNLTVVKAASSMTLKGGTYVYDLQATHSNGTVQTWLTGDFVIVEDITI